MKRLVVNTDYATTGHASGTEGLYSGLEDTGKYSTDNVLTLLL